MPAKYSFTRPQRRTSSSTISSRVAPSVPVILLPILYTLSVVCPSTFTHSLRFVFRLYAFLTIQRCWRILRLHSCGLLALGRFNRDQPDSVEGVNMSGRTLQYAG